MALWSEQQTYQRLARTVSRVADGPSYVVVALFLVLFDGPRGLQFLLTGLSVYALEIPLYIMLKRLFKRERPFKQLKCWHSMVPADEFSFPSGHTAAAAVFAGLLGVFYTDAYLLLMLWVTLVGASRVMAGVHFPGDILAGAVLGLACVLVVV